MEAGPTPPAPPPPQAGGSARGALDVAARIVAAACAALLPLSLLLPFFGPFFGAGIGDVSGWEIFKGSDILILVLAITLIVLCLVSFFTALRLRFVIAPVGFFILGLLVDVLVNSRDLGTLAVGLYVSVLLAALLAASGMALLLGAPGPGPGPGPTQTAAAPAAGCGIPIPRDAPGCGTGTAAAGRRTRRPNTRGTAGQSG